MKSSRTIPSMLRWFGAIGIPSAAPRLYETRSIQDGFVPRKPRALALVATLLLASATSWAATLTYDFNNATLQGWHNRVWDLSANSGTGGWVDLAPNVTAMPGTINGGVIQPPSSDNQLFGNNGTQIDPVGGQNDNHLNTLWLQSPRFVLDGSGDLTAQMARGKAHGSAPVNDASVSYAADGTTGWKGVALRRASDGVFVLAKPRADEGDGMVTVTFTAAELAPFVGTACTLDLINSERGSWGWLSMDNVSIPGFPLAIAMSVATPAVVIGGNTTLTVNIPNNYNATAAVNVYVTNSNPSAVTINGSAAPVVTLNFAMGAATSQNVTIAATAFGYAGLAAGTPGLVSARSGVTVLSPSGLIGRWLSGPEDLQDRSGYMPAGTHDGVMSGGLTPAFSAADVPPGATGSALDLISTGGAVLITNTVTTDGAYRPTFDDGTARQLSVSFWAKYDAGDWNPFVSKYGEGSTGWQVRKRGDQPIATFTLRGTGGVDDPYNSPTLINDYSWHHFAATWDGVAGVRKLYVDGKLNNLVPADFGPMGLANVNYLTLGGRTGAGSSNPGNTFAGLLYDVRIYGRALDGSAVQRLFTLNTDAILAYADTPIIDLGKTGVASVSIPPEANASATVTVYVTNTTPAVVSVAGAVGNVVALTFPAGGATSQTLTLTGLSEGQAQLACAATGLTPATVVIPIYGPHLIGHWFNGAENTSDSSGFTPAGTHDGVEVGSPGTLTFTTDTPPSKPGKAARFGGAVGLQIDNSSKLDANYAPTFDEVISHQCSVAFWAKGLPGTWNPFVAKRGDDAIGWQVRRGYGLTEAFTIRGTPSGNEDGVGSVAINDGLWHHFTAVWDGYAGTRKCYVDGVLDPSIDLTGDFGPMMMAWNHHLVLGAREQWQVSSYPSFDAWFDGALYDVRIYNYPLSQTEAKALAFVAAIKLTPAQRSLHTSQAMLVNVILPEGANQSQPVVVQVTNQTPALVSLTGAVGNVVTLTYPVGGSLTQQVSVVGLADGKAMLLAAGGGFVAGAASINVWSDPGSRLIGRWISGIPDLTETSGFRPAGSHDGVAVGANAGLLSFSPDVPSVAPGAAQSLDLSAGNVAVMITNSATTDYDHLQTFDGQMANKFSITFWAKGTPAGTWDPWVSKRGEDNVGYQVRRFSDDNPVRPTFTLRGSAGNDDPYPGGTVDGSSWHHYAATWDGTTGSRKLYVDGVSVIGLTDDLGPFTTNPGDHLMLGGRDAGGFGHFFQGLLYDVRIYSYALSGAEVGVIVNPPTQLTLSLAHYNIPLRDTVPLVVTLPEGATASSSVTVYLTNNSPGVVTIVGPTALTFPIGSLVQVVNLQAVGAGQINITAGAGAIGSAALVTAHQVIAPSLIGQWFSGAADLLDKSGYTPAGTHDAMVIGANPEALAYSSDVPAGFAGQSLDLTANTNAGITVAIAITNSATSDGGYVPTFDNEMASAFSVTVWAKGLPGGWNAFVSKQGEGIPGLGWQIRRSGGNSEAFTIRGTASGNYDGVGSRTITDGQWHHFAAVWDGVMGTRKCYVDGVLDPSVNLTGDFGPLNIAPTQHIGIGVREQEPAGIYEGWFGGKLYDVRIYNHAISATDAAVLAGVRPTLTVQRWTGNQLRISWPAAFGGYGLEKSSLVASGWGEAGLTVTTEGAENVAYAAIGTGSQFFRLKK